jgi:hypothetical protein
MALNAIKTLICSISAIEDALVLRELDEAVFLSTDISKCWFEGGDDGILRYVQ